MTAGSLQLVLQHPSPSSGALGLPFHLDDTSNLVCIDFRDKPPISIVSVSGTRRSSSANLPQSPFAD
ncbi:hypothetical protein HETIRDRAFT_408709 [Heterobasidion irregulare TC 32-1]|uniref:Uncharacterized protein n=1 Tax=Heterobasidion irregulare (strain TC 32-1) TaxID=747525 RepID=W4KG52_HETIT|nr:uncharacterized protein HETIRDRAFT_408709 [Heterobasidion irregulare TC 32-1]ETW84802.1 hypothetical protein HETIRDRAFT_408709 [Heterobasidion irregulare TC 32-1]